MPSDDLWEIQPHTRIKHYILRRYLNAWFPIMARYNDRIVYIDGFAGRGRYSRGEDGSPIIALKAVLEHPYFRTLRHECEIVFKFIERDSANKDNLNSEISQLESQYAIPDWVKIDVEQGEFERVLTRLLDGIESRGRNLAPTLAFIDPYGFSGLPMRLISRICQNPKCECLVTFMYEYINRFIQHPDENIRRHFDDLFGANDWQEIITEANPMTRLNEITQLYRRQLVNMGGLSYVRSFQMINEGNRTEYFLFFGTNDLTGLSRMKEAMWKADPMWGERFSDISNPAQMVLFSEGETGLLKTLLREKYRGEEPVLIGDIERFVLVDTPYSEKIHLRRRTLMEMERESPPTIIVNRPPGRRNRPGEYPAGTTVRFL
ncbi:MAG: three-Cys-motif partner protein TcmP [Candidatus Tectomicrobia bacterium]|uniref:Three-Cys-motif partner protein TcmP n=1 Tax=Tectimicrobiota bacterium TaxID=2528274 RepID=A0A932MLX5_UNCTE|nr:three-Cys-motif partner protein TcmP [Candidatus Tectomicrobia bacterium]